MNLTRPFFLALAGGAALGFLAPHTGAASANGTSDGYIQKVADGQMKPAGLPANPGKNGWWASSWTTADGAGFFGEPIPLTATVSTDTNVIVRYTRYTTDYDARFHSPIWGAYTVDATTVANDISGERPASNPDFARPSRFFQEPLVVAISDHLGIPAASHDTFTDAIDPLYPPTKAKGDPANIQRGHMVPNNAMKCEGTYEEGQCAQLESFSVANIVPQMAKSNSPSWSALESACLDWANELGQVWVIVGPIYHDKEHPNFAQSRATHQAQIVPCPDELFYVIIGKRGGKTSAIGFVMPHVPDYIDFRTKAVPVQKIQELVGLDFMPDLGEPNPIEATIDPGWLQAKPRKGSRDDP
jgi:DNA/RNA endonuclease G (NUC1)